MNIVLGIVVLAVPTLAGIVCTYLYDPSCEPGWRLPSGIVLGMGALSLIAFSLACAFGLSDWVILLSVLLCAAPLTTLRRADLRAAIQSDLAALCRAFTSLFNGGLTVPVAWVLLYALLAGWLLVAFFSTAIYFQPDGIYSGNVNNYGDLPFHIGIITGFAAGNNYPPQNPELAGARLEYHFLVDFYAALLMRGGFSLRAAIVWQDIVLAFCIAALIARFAWTMTRDRGATLLTPPIVLLCGGLGFEVLPQNARNTGRGIISLIWHPMQSYTISVPQIPSLYWGNMLTCQLMTQRALMLGIPLMLIACIALHQVVGMDKPEDRGLRRAKLLAVGAICALLPLAHIVCAAATIAIAAVAFCAALPRRDLRQDYAYLCIPALLALPQLLWLAHGAHALGVSPSDFRPAWHPGWLAQGDNWIIFWLRNSGPFIPLLLCVFALSDIRRTLPKATVILTIPFVCFFIIANLFQLAPWIWDNSKLLVVWYFGAAPLAALALTMAARLGSRPWGVVTAAALGATLMLSGAIDVWGVTQRTMPVRVFDDYDIAMAQAIQDNVPIDQPVLTAPSCFSGAIMSGRRMIEGFPGHLWTQGYGYAARDQDVRAIYTDAPDAAALLSAYGIEFVEVGPLERSCLPVDDAFFQQFHVAARSGPQTLYDLRSKAGE